MIYWLIAGYVVGCAITLGVFLHAYPTEKVNKATMTAMLVSAFVWPVSWITIGTMWVLGGWRVKGIDKI